ncbi:MAG: ribosome maturation factor RimM [Arenimonas sp.]|jgi:16S rRNA processing protein RimM
MTQERRILLGRVLGAFGVRGELKLHSFTDPVSMVMKYQPWILVHHDQERELIGVRGRETNKGMVITIAGVDDRDAAEALAGAEIWVPRSNLPKPKPGEHYWVDLEGLSVVNREGIELGTVSYLFETGANDVMVVAGERERLIPYIPGQFIVEVDFDAKRITVDWDADF